MDILKLLVVAREAVNEMRSSDATWEGEGYSARSEEEAGALSRELIPFEEHYKKELAELRLIKIDYATATLGSISIAYLYPEKYRLVFDLAVVEAAIDHVPSHDWVADAMKRYQGMSPEGLQHDKKQLAAEENFQEYQKVRAVIALREHRTRQLMK